MRRYETMVIVTDTIEEDAAQELFTWVKDVLAAQGAALLDEAWWGRRKFGYEINKRDHGYYGVLDYHGTAEAVNELERQLKISDDVIRFKTVRPETRIRSSA